jgi:hypothetical protein
MKNAYPKTSLDGNSFKGSNSLRKQVQGHFVTNVFVLLVPQVKRGRQLGTTTMKKMESKIQMKRSDQDETDKKGLLKNEQYL